MKIKKICQQCGKEIKPKIYIYNNLRRYIRINKKFCSKKCSEKGRIYWNRGLGKHKLICQKCGNTFIVNTNHWKRGAKYCSRKCSYLDHKENLFGGINKHWEKGHIPWNKGLTVESDSLIRIIAEKRKGQKRPQMSEFMKKFIKNLWTNAGYKGKLIKKHKELFNSELYLKIFFKGVLFPKIPISELTEIDEKIIEAAILIHKLKKQLGGF